MRRTPGLARELLTEAQEALVQQMLTAKQADRPLTGWAYACRVGGIVAAVRHAWIGNHARARHLHALRGAAAIRKHRYERMGR